MMLTDPRARLISDANEPDNTQRKPDFTTLPITIVLFLSHFIITAEVVTK